MDGAIIKDTPSAYHGRMALSNSGMNELLRCPAHLKTLLDRSAQEEPPSEALLAGSLMHCMVLEPEEMNSRYAPKMFSGATKAGKEEKTRADEMGITLVSKDTWNDCKAMSESILNHPIMRAAKDSGDLRTEQSVYWTERQGTVPCKARVDAIATIPGVGLCAIDLKTTRDASLASLEKSLYNYGYHRQAAWYRRGLRAAGHEVSAFIFLFVEKEAPFLTVGVNVAEAAQEAALDEIRNCVDTFADCMASGIWPGYTESPVIELDLPAWAYKRNQ